MLNLNKKHTKPGGDNIQLISTKKELEKLGIKVDVNIYNFEKYQDYDIVHFFNIRKNLVFETTRRILEVKESGIPIALSTIYWNPAKLEIERRLIAKKQKFSIKRSIRERLGAAIKCSIVPLADLKASHQSYIRNNLYLEYTKFGVHLADVLLPNGQEELRLLIKDIRLCEEKLHTHIIPNGISEEWIDFIPDPESFKRTVGIKDFVLCVANVTYIKNQHSLIRAMHGQNLPLIFIGDTTGIYANECRKLAERLDVKVRFIEYIPQNDLRNAYAAAKAHVLPSWNETPGLVSLEAASMGCNIVVSPFGTTREYFGDDAWYCQPDNLESIRGAVMDAVNSTPRDNLKHRIHRNFTWKIAAKETLKAYECILSRTNYHLHTRVPESLQF